MNGQVKDTGVIVESLLGAIAMVNIPVHDEDLVDVESLLQKFGCDGHRVEVAETPKTTTTLRSSLEHQLKASILPEMQMQTEALHWSAFLCVVSWRSDHSKTILETRKSRQGDQSARMAILQPKISQQVYLPSVLEWPP